MITKIFNDKGYMIKGANSDTCTFFDNSSYKGIPKLVSFYIVELLDDNSHGKPSSNSGKIHVSISEEDIYVSILDINDYTKYKSIDIDTYTVADVGGSRSSSHSPLNESIRVSVLFTPDFCGNYTNSITISYGDSHTDTIDLIFEPNEFDTRYSIDIENKFGEDIMTKWYNAISSSDITNYIDYKLIESKQKEFIVMIPFLAPIINTRKGLEYFIRLFGWMGVEPNYKFIKNGNFTWDTRHKVPDASKTMFFNLINNLNIPDERHELFGYLVYSSVSNNSYRENIEKLVDFAKLVIKYSIGGSILENVIFQANLNIPVGLSPSIHAIETRNIVISNDIDLSFSDSSPYITVDSEHLIDNNDEWENGFDTWFSEEYRGDEFSNISAKTTMTIDSFDLSWGQVEFSWLETTTDAIEPMSWVNGGYMDITKTHIKVYNPVSGEEYTYEGDPGGLIEVDLKLKTIGSYNVIITNTKYNIGDVTTEVIDAINVRMYEPLMMSYYNKTKNISWLTDDGWNTFDGWNDIRDTGEYNMEYSSFPMDELKSSNLISSADYDNDRIGLDEKTWSFFRTSTWDEADNCSWNEWELQREKPKGLVITTEKIERFNTYILIDDIKITFGSDAKSPQSISSKIASSDSEFTSRHIGGSMLMVVDEDFSSDPSIISSEFRLSDEFVKNTWDIDGTWWSNGNLDWNLNYNAVLTKGNDKYSKTKSNISDQPIVVNTFIPVVFSIADSNIHGKNTALWDITSNGESVLSINDSRFVYSFGESGKYDISVVIIDNNGNKSNKLIRKNYITVI